MKTGVLLPFRAGSDDRAAANGPTVDEVPGERRVAECEYLGLDPLRVERAEEACDHSCLREPLWDDGLPKVRPADRDLERGPRHPCDERVPGRAAAVGHAPPADAPVRDVGPVAQPGEHRADVGDLLRAVDPDQAAGLAVPAGVEGEHDVALADAHSRGREADRPGLPEAVHEDHRRPAAARRRAVREGQRRRESRCRPTTRSSRPGGRRLPRARATARRRGLRGARPARGGGASRGRRVAQPCQPGPFGPGRIIRAMDGRPIGVFDSGVGGLTVLHELLVTLPHEDALYLGDNARLPYGPRPLAEMRRFALEVGRHLEREGVKLIVVACNSATAAGLPDLQRTLRGPGRRRAAARGARRRARHAQPAGRPARNPRRPSRAAVTRARPRARRRRRVVAVPCPRLVPLIEGDDPFGEETTAAVREVAAPLKRPASTR